MFEYRDRIKIDGEVAAPLEEDRSPGPSPYPAENDAKPLSSSFANFHQLRALGAGLD